MGLGSGRRDQAQASGDVVGVVVGVQYVGDPQALARGHLQVDVDVPARVDYDGLAAVTEHI